MPLSEISFRFASEKDFDFIWKGRMDIYSIEEFALPDAENEKARIHSNIKNRQIRIALVGEKPSGFLEFTVSNATPFGVSYGKFDRTYAYVDYVYVHPDFRNRKIGTNLYNDLAKHCKEKGINEMICDVFEINKGSKKFHKGLGFKPIVGIYSKKLG